MATPSLVAIIGAIGPSPAPKLRSTSSGCSDDVAVVGLGPIVVLDQVVPEVPFPDDLAGGLAGRLDLDEVVGVQARVTHQVRPAPGGDDLLLRLLLPDDHQHVAVGQPGDVVVREMLLAHILEVPEELAVPVEFLNPAAGARAEAERRRLLSTGAQQVAVLEEVGTHARGVVALPRPHDLSLHVDQISRLGKHRRDQGIPLERPGSLRSSPTLAAAGFDGSPFESSWP